MGNPQGNLQGIDSNSWRFLDRKSRTSWGQHRDVNVGLQPYELKGSIGHIMVKKDKLKDVSQVMCVNLKQSFWDLKLQVNRWVDGDDNTPSGPSSMVLTIDHWYLYKAPPCTDIGRYFGSFFRPMTEAMWPHTPPRQLVAPFVTPILALTVVKSPSESAKASFTESKFVVWLICRLFWRHCPI